MLTVAEVDRSEISKRSNRKQGSTEQRIEIAMELWERAGHEGSCLVEFMRVNEAKCRNN